MAQLAHVAKESAIRFARNTEKFRIFFHFTTPLIFAYILLAEFPRKFRFRWEHIQSAYRWVAIFNGDQVFRMVRFAGSVDNRG